MDILACQFGQFQLQRLPLRRRETLQAFDQADLLMLARAFEHCEQIGTKASVLIVNDQFGALSVAMSQYQPCNWSDSRLSHLATIHNYTLNQIDRLPDNLSSTEALVKDFDLVLIRLPKTLALLEHQLILLKQHLKPGAVVIGAAMSKYIQRSMIELFEQTIGPTHTSLAEKKARLILPTVDDAIAARLSPYPDAFEVPEYRLQLQHHANVFSRKQLDIGARFLIEQFEQLPDAHHIIDLACGNGVLGIMAKRYRPGASVHFYDESYMAVASAKDNVRINCGESGDSQFYVNDCLDGVASDSADCILCNPPFHQQQTIGEHIARQMFSDSHRVLKNNGQLWVVANRHLPYRPVLNRLFRQVRVVASNRKFCTFCCTK